MFGLLLNNYELHNFSTFYRISKQIYITPFVNEFLFLFHTILTATTPGVECPVTSYTRQFLKEKLEEGSQKAEHSRANCKPLSKTVAPVERVFCGEKERDY